MPKMPVITNYAVTKDGVFPVKGVTEPKLLITSEDLNVLTSNDRVRAQFLASMKLDSLIVGGITETSDLSPRERGE